MLSDVELYAVVKSVQNFWDSEMKANKELLTLADSKNPGRKLFSIVEEKTAAHLVSEKIPNVVSKISTDKKGNQKKMGADVLINENQVNIKFSTTGKKGRPNITSMRKIFAGIHNENLDSYYCLFLELQNGKIKVSGVNLFDILEFTHFDAGPGQLMLKKDKYAASTYPIHRIKLKQVDKILVDMYETQMNVKIVNMRKAFDKIKAGSKKFQSK